MNPIVPDRWEMLERRNGSIEIRSGRRLVAIVTREHPKMMGNAIVIQNAPALLAATLNYLEARCTVPDPRLPAGEQLVQEGVCRVRELDTRDALFRLARSITKAADNARPPRRKHR